MVFPISSVVDVMASVETVVGDCDVVVVIVSAAVMP